MNMSLPTGLGLAVQRLVVVLQVDPVAQGFVPEGTVLRVQGPNPLSITQTGLDRCVSQTRPEAQLPCPVPVQAPRRGTLHVPDGVGRVVPEGVGGAVMVVTLSHHKPGAQLPWAPVADPLVQVAFTPG